MTNQYVVGQNDAGWTLDVLCSDANGPVELVAASEILLFIGKLYGGGPDDGLTCSAVADYAFTNGAFDNPGNSGKHCIARHVGTSSETTDPGTYQGRIQVAWPSGTVRSFPTTNLYFTFIVTPRP